MGSVEGILQRNELDSFCDHLVLRVAPYLPADWKGFTLQSRAANAHRDGETSVSVDGVDNTIWLFPLWTTSGAFD